MTVKRLVAGAGGVQDGEEEGQEEYSRPENKDLVKTKTWLDLDVFSGLF